MCRPTVPRILILVLMAACACAAHGAAEPAGKLVPPPAIYLPYGGRTITEVNLSDDDALAALKQVLPCLTDLIKAGAARQYEPQGVSFSKLDLKPLVEAIEGVKDVRVVVAQYPVSRSEQTLLREMERGISKAGDFSRGMGGAGLAPEGLAIYSEAGNAGYLAFAYDARGHTLCAIRIVGFLDVTKLTQWALQTAQDAGLLPAGFSAAPQAPAQDTPPEPEAQPGS